MKKIHPEFGLAPALKAAVAVCCAVLLSATVLKAQSIALPDSSMNRAYEQGSLLVKFKDPTLSEPQRESIRQSYRAQRRKQFARTGLELWQLDNSYKVSGLCRELAGRPEIEYAEPNYSIHADLTPNDEKFAQQWNLNNTGQLPGSVAGADIDAPEAWSIHVGSKSIIVAVIDTGVDYNHPDLAANIWKNPKEIAGNGLDDDGNGYVDDLHGIDAMNGDSDPMDDHYHGTHCAGIIGASGNNQKGVAGICWNVSIMPLKHMDFKADGNVATAVECIEYAIEHGARIISASWGEPQYSFALYDAVKQASQAGILFCTSAGNEGNDLVLTPQYPACYDLPNILVVTSTDNKDQLANHNFSEHIVHIAAPGVSILSTYPDGKYKLLSGTSMATPLAAGTAALTLSSWPKMPLTMLHEMLLDTGKSKPEFAAAVMTSRRLNARQALIRAKGGHYLTFDRSRYFTGAKAKILLYDGETQDYSPRLVSVSTSGGDSETLLLHSSSHLKGLFTNSMPVAYLKSAAAPGLKNGKLEGGHDVKLFATYKSPVTLRTLKDEAQIDLQVKVGVTELPAFVAFPDFHMDLDGVVNGNVPVQILVSNVNSHYSTKIDFTPTDKNNHWKLPSFPLMYGNNKICLLASNQYGSSLNRTLQLVIVTGFVGMNYVDAASKNPCWPYLSWETASTNIQNAINAAAQGNIVLVQSGVYKEAVVHEIPTLDLTIRSVNGSGSTTIDGEGLRRPVTLRGGRLEGFKITGGCTTQQGGGAYLEHQAILKDCLISDNNASQLGGGVFAQEYSQIQSCQLSGNKAESGAGAALIKGAQILNSTIKANKLIAGGSGAGLSCEDALVENCVITFNLGSGYGGGASVRYTTLKGCVFENNTAYHGGGIQAEESTVLSCSFKGNTGSFGGAAIKGKGSLNLDDCIISGHTAGCAVKHEGVSSGNLLAMSNCYLSGNSAGLQASGDVAIHNCAFEYQLASTPVVYVTGGDLDVRNVLIANNQGIGLQVDQSTGVVSYATIANNKDVGLLLSGNSSVDASHSILWGQVKKNWSVSGNEHSFTYCCTTPLLGLPDAQGCFDANPLFVKGPLGDQYLSQTTAGQAKNSPCVNAGVSGLAVPEGSTRTDEVPDAASPDLGYHYPIP
ncbi:MAG: hypothetical protein A2X46_02140 [Lentisphaerae bacterium GWF2_57_35]|nr:MAG: hypothetical protein A2X46_02140 [Lentisphaerae bacterium GWF2_57_35]